MLLRASSEIEGGEADLHAVTEGTESGVPDGDVLIAFAEAAVAHDAEALPAARARVAERMGAESLVDAAAIVANFQRMVRIADGSGIALDTPLALVSVDLRDELGIDAFGSAEATPKVAGLRRLLGRAMSPFLPLMFRLFGPARRTS